MRLTTKQAARGKWDGIICELIGEQAITRRHGPCPICGGKDRYRYDNGRNDGDWFCNICGVGDGFSLLTGALEISFAEAAQRVDKIVGNIEATPFKNPETNIEQRRDNLKKVWLGANDQLVAANYLLDRGIPSTVIGVVNDIHGHSELEYYQDGKLFATIPAMIAVIRNARGEAISIHRTYMPHDTREKPIKKIMPGLEKLTGACIRLGEPKDTLVLAEGIETALAAWAITGYPAWATISAHGLESFQAIPKHVKKVIICADNDASFTGQAAAFTAAKYFKQRLKVETVVTMPRIIGMDALDALNELRGDPAHSPQELSVNDIEIGLMRWAP